MKLPSLHYLLNNAKTAFLRFPLTILSAFAAVVIGVFLTEQADNIGNVFPYINLLLCMALGVPLYFCTAVLSVKMGFGSRKKLGAHLFATAILVAVFFSLPGYESTHNTTLPYIKYGIYNMTIHLFVSFVPFISSRQLNGFWQYNKILFIRFLASVLYSGVLYLGLALALGALKLLFDIDLHNELFLEMFIVIGGLMNTWFFVSGIPGDLEQLENLSDYPRGLKIFTQYILLPLLALYLVILYFYGGKILIQWNWPKGIVSYLIIYISVLGILTFLLLHPYGKLPGNGWIQKISRGYYLALYPLLVIFFIAIGLRVSDYGITVNRYSLILLGVWLFIVCTYISLGRSNIKFIPSSLACILLVASFGPWGIFSVSERNQVMRLQELLEKNKLLVNGKIKNEVIWTKDSLKLHSEKEDTNEGVLNDSLHNEVWSIIHYLDDHHGFRAIRPWFRQNIDSVVTVLDSHKKNRWDETEETEVYMRSLGLIHYQKRTPGQENQFSYHAFVAPLVPVSGYDYLGKFDKYYYASDSTVSSLSLDGSTYTVSYVRKPEAEMHLYFRSKTVPLGFKALKEKLYLKYGAETKSEIPLAEMRLTGLTDGFEFVFEFHDIEMTKKTGIPEIASFSGNIFIRRTKTD